ncbi:Hydrolethalus syndrome protein 1-like protein [Xyrichtys novacula]|uniref:Hydrolethalus syndrome protein 1-like protein n=1 Tax=Xyrichtys novacula TaxID=13765 RepID=A0AAV1F034_XYRNO|nr:Hydrolethalus syndrome protein 1-like protein [Xyrichtys novacula]
MEEESDEEEESAGGRSSESEGEEEEVDTSEEDSTPANEAEDSLQETNQENLTGPSSGEEEEEEEEEGRTSEEEESTKESSEEEKPEREEQEKKNCSERRREEEEEEKEEDTVREEEEEKEEDTVREEEKEEEEKEEDTVREEEKEEEEDAVREEEEEEKEEDTVREEEEEEEEDTVREEEEEEKEEDTVREEDLKADPDEEDSQQQENPDLQDQDHSSRDCVEGQSEEEDGDHRSDSPAPSMMTSGYGTIRPEEQEGGDGRDDHTIAEFDQDSRGDLSEVRDEEERSLWSFGGFDVETTEPDFRETPSVGVSADAERGADDEEVDVTDMKPGDHEKSLDLCGASEEHLHAADGDGFKEGEEESDESSSNKDVKFIDSKDKFSSNTYGQMFEGWEGNLRHQRASCLEERLAELHVSSPAQRETENDEVGSHSETQSSGAEGDALSAFESYIRGMTRSRSDGDIRPKPKSFIRPTRNQQTRKKTDPVAKYFQYKQIWEMFKLPGETDRRALRQEIKDQLAYQPPPPKPRRVYVPNTYIVPTEKKRSALCWEIRNDLANGLLPQTSSYRF